MIELYSDFLRKNCNLNYVNEKDVIKRKITKN